MSDETNKLTNVYENSTVIGEVTYTNDFSEDLRIDKTNLDEEFMHHSEKYAYYAGLSELAEYRLSVIKLELETLEAQLDHEKRQAAQMATANGSSIKYTEKMYSHEVTCDPRYQVKARQHLEAQKTAGLLNRARESFQHRKDCLSQMGQNSRVGSYDPRILNQTAAGIRMK